MRLRGWLRSRQANSVGKGEIKELTDQFHITLRASFARVQAADGRLTPDALHRLNEL